MLTIVRDDKVCRRLMTVRTGQLEAWARGSLTISSGAMFDGDLGRMANRKVAQQFIRAALAAKDPQSPEKIKPRPTW